MVKLTPIVSIIVIGALEIYALSQGIDGVVLAGTIAVIAALGGYNVSKLKRK